jgi:DNA-binding response OmpR family regulator
MGAAQPAAAARPLCPAAARPLRLAAAAGSILLVEDDLGIADALILHLGAAGFAVRHEADGRRAMAAIEAAAWRLVLLDIMLPGIDGWEICRRLRARHAGTPVIMLSARAAEEHRVFGLDLGADDYLAKPFSMLELVARIRALLRRAGDAAETAAPLRFGRCTLDPRRRTLERDGRSVPLTLREFDLLRCLAAQGGATIPRQALLEQVWGEGFDGYEHTVNSHINRLRTKIEADPRRPRHIVTVWGVGYRFEHDP